VRRMMAERPASDEQRSEEALDIIEGLRDMTMGVGVLFGKIVRERISRREPPRDRVVGPL